MKEYEEEFSQKPTVPEISSLLGVSEQMVKASMESLKFQNMISIDASIGNESGNRLISETIPDNCQKSLDEMIDHKKMLNVIKKCLSSLSDREEQILRLRFGITEDFSNSEDFNMSSSELSEIIIKGEKNVDA
jgi:DNA-directed RNA polymerase sigma subunit (sigma70/sigma32)